MAFNHLDQKVDYMVESEFELNSSQINLYKGFAIRDYNLIASHLHSLSIKKPDILEIGSGYGFLGNNIQERIPIGKYYHFEINTLLKNELKKRGQTTIDSLTEIEHIDIIIMIHVLEHIETARLYLEDLIKRYPQAQIILYQTNYKGIIPKYFSWFWYGWSLNQHYYHFTPKSLTIFFARHAYKVNFLTYYKLDQKFSFNPKGIVKGILYIINLFVHGAMSDAFVISFKK